MADYKTMYCRLCRAADDAVSMIEEDAQNAEAAAALLREALLDAEALFLEAKWRAALCLPLRSSRGRCHLW